MYEENMVNDVAQSIPYIYTMLDNRGIDYKDSVIKKEDIVKNQVISIFFILFQV